MQQSQQHARWIVEQQTVPTCGAEDTCTANFAPAYPLRQAFFRQSDVEHIRELSVVAGNMTVLKTLDPSQLTAAGVNNKGEPMVSMGQVVFQPRNLDPTLYTVHPITVLDSDGPAHSEQIPVPPNACQAAGFNDTTTPLELRVVSDNTEFPVWFGAVSLPSSVNCQSSTYDQFNPVG